MRILIIILWFFLGLAYWYISKNCCEPVNELLTESIHEEAPNHGKKVKNLIPVNFSNSGDQPNTEMGWNKFRDSLVNNLGENSVLSIKGFYFNDETYEGTENLGIARAKNAYKLFENLGEDRVVISSEAKSEKFIQEEVNNLISFKYLEKEKKVTEIDDKTIIRFAFNSTKRLKDAEVESYLDQVAKRLVSSAEKVSLVGHTDDVGGDASNILLGEQRATAIKDYLIRKGVNPSKIFVSSKGERSPVALNSTQAGRDQNRRVELQIIK